MPSAPQEGWSSHGELTKSSSRISTCSFTMLVNFQAILQSSGRESPCWVWCPPTDSTVFASHLNDASNMRRTDGEGSCPEGAQLLEEEACRQCKGIHMAYSLTVHSGKNAFVDDCGSQASLSLPLSLSLLHVHVIWCVSVFKYFYTYPCICIHIYIYIYIYHVISYVYIHISL